MKILTILLLLIPFIFSCRSFKPQKYTDICCSSDILPEFKVITSQRISFAPQLLKYYSGKIQNPTASQKKNIVKLKNQFHEDHPDQTYDPLFQKVAESVFKTSRKDASKNGTLSIVIKSQKLKINAGGLLLYPYIIIGFPVASYKCELTLDAAVLKNNGYTPLLNYETSVRKTSFFALYWGYHPTSAPKVACYDAYRKGLTDIRLRMENDVKKIQEVL